MTAPKANFDHNTIIISLNSGHTAEQEFNSKTYRIFDINHTIQALQQFNRPDLFAKTRNVDEMVCSFMPVIDKAIPFANSSLRIHKTKE